MAKKNSPPPVILPARMSLCPNAFEDLEIAVLEFPYQQPIKKFMSALATELGKRPKPWYYPPYRLLNNAISACTPTVVHGFEKYGLYPNNGRRMLAVGRLDGNPSLQYPSEENLAQLIRVWIHQWGQSPALKKYTEGDLEIEWHELETSLDQAPDTQWTKISPDIFLEKIYAENGLAFNAVPGLLATLLHEKTSVIGKNKVKVKWRRAQDDKNSLCVVSQPIPISFTKPKGRYGQETVEKEGCFTYKLVFRVQLQTGRPQPWIYAFLHCQRYVEQALCANKRGNNITVLAGINQDRLDGWEHDTTLVRLKAMPSLTKKGAKWVEALPELLAAMNARSLTTPHEIYQSPQSFWRKTLSQPTNDEYYIPYVEGYKYKNRGSHSVATGFGLAERSAVIEQVCCNLLHHVLQPDTHLQPDQPIFDTKNLPLALKTFKDLAQKPKTIDEKQAKKAGIETTLIARQQHNAEANRKQRTERQPIILNALKKVLKGKKLSILIVYRKDDTKIAVYQQLREAFLLNEAEPFPSCVVVTNCPILDAELLAPLDVGNLNPAHRHRPQRYQPSDFDRQWNANIFDSYRRKRDAWQAILKKAKPANDNAEFIQTVLIELPENPSDTSKFHSSQTIKGAIREACAQEQILSQMLLPIPLKSEVQEPTTEGAKGRGRNSVQDLITRQLGILYGAPEDIYQAIDLPSKIAKNLDVIAFCITESSKAACYCCAIRLSADGIVDVRLPNSDHWIPYSEAGWQVGQAFGDAHETVNSSSTARNPIKLTKAALSSFLETTLTTQLRRPTIALIKAQKWRERRIAWEQLTVGRLTHHLNVLQFTQDTKSDPTTYVRSNKQLNNLLCVIRIRAGEETPQYITNRETWKDEAHAKDLTSLSGFVENTENNVFHYFSVGRLPKTVGRPQSVKSAKEPYKIEDGGGISFKHQQMVEMVPFFVHSDFQSGAKRAVLCRVPHYLRSTPAWSMGNIVLPYPMHLGDSLLKDHLCILSE